MACEYFVNGKWVQESEFKELLFNGLLDQLVENEGLEVGEDFIVDKGYVNSLNNKKVNQSENIRVRIVKKINKNFNNSREVEDGKPTDRWTRKKPHEVVKSANTAITAEEKRTGKKRQQVPFVLAIRIGSELKMGKASKKDLEWKAKLTEGNFKDPTLDMKEGIPYMIIPTSEGARVVQLRNSFLGETNIADDIKVELAKLFTANDTEFKKIAKDLQKKMMNIELSRRGNSIIIVTKEVGESGNKEIVKTEKADNVVELANIIVGTYDKGTYVGARDSQGNMLTPGKLARVNYKEINGKGVNQKYSEQGFITTDLYHEKGNFINSSSFIIETEPSSGLSVEEAQELSKALPTEEQAASANTVSDTTNRAKSDESPIYNQPLENLVTVVAREFTVKEGIKVRIFALMEDGKVEVYRYERLDQVPNSNIFKKSEEPLTATQEEKARKQFFALEDVKKFKTKKDISKTEKAKKVTPVTPEPQPEDMGELADLVAGTNPDLLPDIDIAPTGQVEEATGGVIDIGDLSGEAEDLGFDETPKTRVVTNGTHWDKESELNWIREKLGKAVSDGITMFDTQEELEQYLGPKAYEYLRNISKRPGALQGLFTNAGLYLKNNAFIGTAYHEAFHVVFNLALSKADQLTVLKEAATLFKDELSDNPTFIEVEELLADKFMEYVQSNGTIDHSKKEGKKTLGQKIVEFFKSIFRLFNGLFNKKATITIESLFSDIQTGKFKDQINFKNTDTSEFLNMRTRKTSFLDVRLEKEALQYMKQKFFLELDRLRKEDAASGKNKFKALSDPELINEVGVPYMLGITINTAVKDYVAHRRTNPNSDLAKQLLQELGILNINEEGAINQIDEGIKLVTIGNKKVLAPVKEDNFPLIQKFISTLKYEDGIIIKNFAAAEELVEDLKERTEDDVTQEETTNLERWQQDIAYFDPRTTMSQRLKRVFNNFHYFKPNTEEALTNRFGARVTYPGNEVFSFLSQRITDSTSIDHMLEKLNALVGERDFIKQLLQLIQSDPSILTDLYVNLGSKSNINYSTVFEEKGEYRIFAANRQRISDVTKEFLMSNFLSQRSKLFNTYEEGLLAGQKDFLNINKKEVKKQLDLLTHLKQELENARGNDILKVLNKISDFFHSMELPITQKHLIGVWAPNRVGTPSSPNRVKDVLNATENILKKMELGENPFVVIKGEKTKVQVRGKLVEADSNVVVQLAAKLKLGLETEVNMAFRDSNNKSKYTVQYSNYLNKLFSKFKDPARAKEVWENIKNDPLLSNLPIFDEIFENKETGELSSFVAGLEGGLEVRMLEALKRKGKTFATDYKNMSPEELEAVALAHFQNGKSNSEAWYKLPIPADSTSIPFIKARKYSNEEIINKLVQVAQGEIARINKLNSLHPDHPLRKLGSKESKSYINKGTKFQVLSFLNNSKLSLEEMATNEDALKKEIETFMNDSYLGKELKAAEANNILSINEGQVTFAKNIISKSVSKREGGNYEFYKNYLFNQFYMNIELTTLLAGDPSFYKSTEDYQKRYKQVLSPGTYISDLQTLKEYSGLIFQDELVPTEKDTVDSIIELIKKDSNLSPKKKAELISIWKDKGTEDGANNNSDGATFISVDRYLEILDGLNRLTDKHKEAAKRIEKGEESIEDIALFPPIKPFMFTKRNIDGTEVPVQIKNSEVLLTKAMANRKDVDGNIKYPKLAAMYEILQNRIETADGWKAVDFIAFESAVKVGAIAQTFDDKGNPVYDTLEEVDGNYQLSENPTVITLKNSDWKLQQETPPHYVDEEGNHGSQIRNLAIADLEFDAVYEDGKTGREIAIEYQELIVANIQEAAKGVAKIFYNEEGEFDIEKLASYLKREIEDRQLGDDYLDALEIVTDITDPSKKDTAVPLWHPALNMKAQNLMYSFVKNRVIKQKINGGNMINTTGYGISGDLKMKIDKKSGTITFEALLPWWSKKFFPQKENGEIDMSVLPEELTEIIGYRIPTEDKYSMFNIKVKGFTDPAQGGTIILPAEATTIAGLDFDIDKLFMLIPNYYLTGKKGEQKANYIKPLKKGASTEEIVNHVYRDFRALRTLLETYLPEGVNTKNVVNTIEQILHNRRELGNYRKQVFEEKGKAKQIQREILFLERQLSSAKGKKLKTIQQQLNDKAVELEETEEINFNEEIANTNEQVKAIKNAIIESLKGVDIDINLIQGKKARDNRIIEITQAVLKHKNTSSAILDPGGFAEEKALGQKLRILKIADKTGKLAKLKAAGIELFEKFEKGKITVIEYQKELDDLVGELDEVDFNINYPSTQRELFTRNMTGAALIGIFANHNVNHAKAQLTTLTLAYPITIDGTEYSSLNQIYADTKDGKVRISKSLANLLAAAVDNAKDPIASYLNLNTFTADIASAMLRLGINKETAFTLLNQPIIQKVTDKYFASKGSQSEITKSFKEIKEELKAEILNAKNLGITAEDLKEIDESTTSGLDINLGMLQKGLVKEKSKEYFITQYSVLNWFGAMYAISTELGTIVRNTKTDASSPGPSHGATFSMLYRQHKMLNKQEPLILGAEDFVLQQGTEGAMINAAFTQYGWRDFVNIVNEIFPAIGKTREDGRLSLSALGKIKVLFSNMKDSIYSIDEKEANSIDNAMLSFLVSGFPFFNYSQSENILLNTPDELQEFITKNPDSPYSPFLEQLMVKSPDRNSDFRRIQFYTTGKTPLDIENYKRLWREMLVSTDPKVNQLATNLIKYSFFNSGFNFGPYTFFHLIPMEVFTDKFAHEYPHLGLIDETKGRTLNTHIKVGLRALETGNAIDLDRFKTQFVQNRGARSKMIVQIDAEEELPYAHTGSEYYTASDVFVTTGKENTGKLVKAEVRNGSEFRINPTRDFNEYLKQLEKLIQTARANPKLTFHIAQSLNNANFPGKKKNEAFRHLHKTIGIPNNVRFKNQYSEVRFFTKGAIEKGKLNLSKMGFGRIMIRNEKGEKVFPPFLRTGFGEKARLFKLVAEGQYNVTYTEIANLGESNVVVEYNMLNDINETVARKVAAKTSSPVVKIDPNLPPIDNSTDTGSLIPEDPSILKAIKKEGTPEQTSLPPLPEGMVGPSEAELAAFDAIIAEEEEKNLIDPSDNSLKEAFPDSVLLDNLTYDMYLAIVALSKKPAKITRAEFEKLTKNSDKLGALKRMRDC